MAQGSECQVRGVDSLLESETAPGGGQGGLMSQLSQGACVRPTPCAVPKPPFASESHRANQRTALSRIRSRREPSKLASQKSDPQWVPLQEAPAVSLAGCD